jgi:hypothetical protein
MVKEKKVKNKKLFQCDVCGHGYINKEIARKCEVWCQESGACSTAITKKAVYYPSLPSHLTDISKE